MKMKESNLRNKRVVLVVVHVYAESPSLPYPTTRALLRSTFSAGMCLRKKKFNFPTKRARSATRCNARCMANAGLPRLVFKSAEDGCYAFPLAGLRQGISLRLSLIVDYIRSKLRSVWCVCCGWCVCGYVFFFFSFCTKYSIQWNFSPFPFFVVMGLWYILNFNSRVSDEGHK